MLRLIKTDKYTTNQPHRLWFSDCQYDLFIWLDNDNCPVSFQFSYDKLINEHVLIWHQHSGYSHYKIDDGENSYHNYKMSPVMKPDGEVNSNRIVSLFRSVCTDLPRQLAESIINRIESCNS